MEAAVGNDLLQAERVALGGLPAIKRAGIVEITKGVFLIQAVLQKDGCKEEQQ